MADIENLLKDNECDYSAQAVDQFLEKFDVRHFEKRCIEFGWELMQAMM